MKDHLSGPNLRYNVSWTEPSTDYFTHFETVLRPNLVIFLGNKTIDSAEKKCYTIALAVQPVNDVGTGPLSTDTVVHISREGMGDRIVRGDPGARILGSIYS